MKKKVVLGMLSLLFLLWLVFVYTAASPPDYPGIAVSDAAACAGYLYSQAEGKTNVRPLPKCRGYEAVVLHWSGLRIIAQRGKGAEPIQQAGRVLAETLVKRTNLQKVLSNVPMLLSFAGKDKAIPLQNSFLWNFTVVSGVDGLVWKSGRGNAYIFPEETLHPWFSGGRVFPFLPLRFGVRRAGVVSTLAGSRRLRSGEGKLVPLRRPGGRGRSMELRRFRVRSFYCSRVRGKTVVRPAFRLSSPVPDVIRRKDVRKSAAAAGDWFLAHLDRKTKTFSYRYQPWINGVNRSGYSFPRHAGSVLILYRIFAVTKDNRYLKGADLALDYLLARLHHAPRGLYIREVWWKGKLGSAALCALALFERRLATGEKKYDQKINGILDFIEFMQLPSGRLSPYYLIRRRSPDSKTIAQNFPGQALWALARGIRYLGRGKSAFVRGMDFQTTRAWNFFLSDYYIFPLSWEMQAILEVSSIVRKSSWEKFLFKAADSMFDFQYRTRWPFPDYRGGFGTPEWFVPLAHAAGFQGEGLAAAYGYARRYGFGDRAARYRRGLHLMSRFLLSQQVSRESSVLYPVPGRAVGAFRGGPGDHRQQIDYTQHVLAALLNSMEEGVY